MQNFNVLEFFLANQETDKYSHSFVSYLVPSQNYTWKEFPDKMFPTAISTNLVQDSTAKDVKN